MKQPVTISIEEDVWKQFQCLCIHNNKKPSEAIETYMKAELKKKGGNSEQHKH